MPRLATTLTLSAWLGFLAMLSMRVALASLEGTSAAHPLDVAGGLLLAGSCLAGAGLLAYALTLVHGRNPSRIARGAGIGLTVIALIGGLIGLGQLMGWEAVAAEGMGVWWAVAVSAALIMFDRLVQVDDDEAAFEAGITAIAEGMARQVHLYSDGDISRGRGRR